ncbi:MAG: hypothetical protein DRI46_12065 [Chloroflexi bacterium]|nr:MAG: hypothetical protein DRI46_12065 [Chloroflexota bacterium]
MTIKHKFTIVTESNKVYRCNGSSVDDVEDARASIRKHWNTISPGDIAKDVFLEPYVHDEDAPPPTPESAYRPNIDSAWQEGWHWGWKQREEADPPPPAGVLAQAIDALDGAIFLLEGLVDTRRCPEKDLYTLNRARVALTALRAQPAAQEGETPEAITLNRIETPADGTITVWARDLEQFHAALQRSARLIPPTLEVEALQAQLGLMTDKRDELKRQRDSETRCVSSLQSKITDLESLLTDQSRQIEELEKIRGKQREDMVEPGHIDERTKDMADAMAQVKAAPGFVPNGVMYDEPAGEVDVDPVLTDMSQAVNAMKDGAHGLDCGRTKADCAAKFDEPAFGGGPAFPPDNAERVEEIEQNTAALARLRVHRHAMIRSLFPHASTEAIKYASQHLFRIGG